MSLVESFPSADQPRSTQIEILQGIDSAIQRGTKFIVVQAPTGVGKSHISATLANYSRPPASYFSQLANKHRLFAKDSDGCYAHQDIYKTIDTFGAAVLTCSKALQDQYMRLFSDASILKGRSNYQCDLNDFFTCDFAPCHLAPGQVDKCNAVNRCAYFNARRDTLSSKLGVYNYSSFLSLPPYLRKKQFLVCDEASEIEDELVKHFACHLNYKSLRFADLGIDPLRTTDKNKALQWLTDVFEVCKTEHNSIVRSLAGLKNNRRKMSSEHNRAKIYKTAAEQMSRVLQSWYMTEYIIEPTSVDVRITPVNIDLFAQQIFAPCETVVLLSGTIIDHKTFTKTLGITDYEFIEVESEFDSSKSPIYCLDKVSLNYNNMQKELPKIIEYVKAVCNKYPNDKGIIHTHTHAITQQVGRAVEGSRFLVRDVGTTNEALIESHKMSDVSTVLISPSLGFGTDLADNFGRFSIIVKTPYLSLGDKRVKLLAQRDPKWYQMKALVSLVQMCGRTTRSKEDYSDTFILDGAAVNLIRKNTGFLPKYFLERLH